MSPASGNAILHARSKSDPQRSTEASGGIVRLRTVVIQEHRIVAAIAKEGAAELSDLRRGFHPARRLQVELAEILKLPVLFFRQKLDAHGRRQIDGAILWLVLFPR